MRPPDAPVQLADMGGGAGVDPRLQIAAHPVAIPEGDAIFILGHFEQTGERLAVLGQAEHAAVDVMFTLPTKEMAGFRGEGAHAIGVGVGPDGFVELGQKVIAEHIREECHAAGAAVGDEFVTVEDFAAMAHLDPVGDIRHLAVMVEGHVMAVVEKGLYAQLFDIAQRAFDPQHCDMVPITHFTAPASALPDGGMLRACQMSFSQA